jgi:DNA polymerase-3 subunit gamma/tau
MAAALPATTVKMKDIRHEFTSTTSIKKPISSSALEPLTPEEEQARSETATPFTQEALINLWDEYAERLKNDSPHLYSTMKNSRPQLDNDWNIRFTLDNKVLHDELNNNKTALMEFLRNRLNNYRIQLHTIVAETPRNHKPYTDKEKFDRMAEKNPALRNLREELDLEIEY